MKISVTNADGDKLTLGDDAKGKAVTFLPSCDRNIQVSEKTRAVRPDIYDRQNSRTTLNFTVEVEHDTPAAALAHSLEHFDEVPITGDIELIETVGGRMVRRVLEGAGIPTVRFVEVCGVTTVCQYVAIGGELKKV